MHVFLSWSGQQSHAVATVLSAWIAQVIQVAEPWISSEIEKGSRWNPEVSDKLEASRVGIICLTPDNLDAHWILFEAGALSKEKDAQVCTFLLGVQPADVKQPLGQFQHTSFEKSDVRKLMSMINVKVGEAGEKSLGDRVFADSFETFWPRLEESLGNILNAAPSTQATPRPQEDMLREILEIVRTQERWRHTLAADSVDGAARLGQPRVGVALNAGISPEARGAGSFRPPAEILDGTTIAAWAKPVRDQR